VAADGFVTSSGISQPATIPRSGDGRHAEKVRYRQSPSSAGTSGPGGVKHGARRGFCEAGLPALIPTRLEAATKRRRWLEVARRDRLAVSSVTLAELAAGGRSRDAVDEDLRDFEVIPVDADAAWRAGVAFRQYRRKDTDDPVLPDFFIRAQAAMHDLRHLTNDRRRTKSFSEVDFEFVD
jgi:predicted nucleic acid-binding protein